MGSGREAGKKAWPVKTGGGEGAVLEGLSVPGNAGESKFGNPRHEGCLCVHGYKLLPSTHFDIHIYL